MQIENDPRTLDACKKAIRVTNSAFDDEIQDLINACKLDLKLSGVASAFIIDEDPLIKHAIKTYVKGHFGYDNSDADKFKHSYNLLKQHLAIAYSKEVSNVF